MRLAGKPEGAFSDDNQVLGTYLHGLFDSPKACDALLGWTGYNKQNSVDLDSAREAGINLITDALEATFDFKKMQKGINEFS
jgi:adenosylcobyric acid synthase